MATLATLDAILKEHYIGPLVEELNQETFVLDWFEKMTVDWAGRRCIVPIHVGRNTGTGWAGEFQNMPAAGQQATENLVITARHVYGRFNISGPAMAALKKGGVDSFVGYTELEMDKLKEDVRDRVNQATISGGRCVGFMYQQNCVGAGGAPDDWLFDGDYAKVNALVAAAVLAGQLCTMHLVRMSDKFEHQTQITIAGATAAAGTIQLTTLLDTTLLGATGWDPGAVFGLALEPNDVYAVVIDGAAAALAICDLECNGIYANIGMNGLYAISGGPAATGTAGRGAFAGYATYPPVGAAWAGYPALRPIGMCTVPDGGGLAPVNTRVALLMDVHLQGTLDRLTNSEGGGGTTDIMLMNALQRSRYAALLSGTISADFAQRAGAKKGEGGFTGFSYAGIPFKLTRHINSGHIVFLESNGWKMLELEGVGWLDEDGSILSRIANQDAYEGATKWYFNIACIKPGHQGVVCGLQM